MNKPSKSKTSYPSQLSKPMPEPVFHSTGLLMSVLSPQQEAENSDRLRAHLEEIQRRMTLLLEWYGLPPDSWFSLAYLLARQTIPGLRTAAKGGRPPEWDVFRTARLRREIDVLIANSDGRLSVDAAAKQLAKKAEWKPKASRVSKPWEVLRRRYYEADPRWVRIIEHADAWDELVKKGSASVSS